MAKTTTLGKLRGRIYEKYNSISDFADVVGKNKSTISMILNAKRKMTTEDIQVFCGALDIKKEEIADYFFDQKS